MCRSGVPLPRALRSLQAEVGGRRLRDELSLMATEIEAGEPFEVAYAKRKKDFPEFYQVLVETGIETGDLVGVLDEIAGHAEMRARVGDRLRRALSYPVMVALFVIAIGLGVSLYATSYTQIVSPSIAGVSYIEARGDTWILNTVAMGALLILVMGVGMFVWMRNPVDATTGPFGNGFRIPFVGRLRSYATKAWFASTLAMLLRRKLPLEQALGFACLAQKNRAVREQIELMVNAAGEGDSLHESIRKGQLISPGLLWFVETATSPSEVAVALDDVARVYRQRLDRSLDRICVFAVPALELCIGVAVLLFALSYLFPALSSGLDVLGIFGFR